MDIFIEQIVKRDKRPIDYIKLVLLLFGAVVFMYLAVYSAGFIGWIGTILFFACAAIVYLIYRAIIGLNVEFEYCLTNGSFDVDKIIAKRSRKHIITLNAREIEIFAPKSDRSFKRHMDDSHIKKIYACTSINDEDVAFIVFSDNETQNMLLFNPNKKIKDAFRRLNPQKVMFNDED